MNNSNARDRNLTISVAHVGGAAPRIHLPVSLNAAPRLKAIESTERARQKRDLPFVVLSRDVAGAAYIFPWSEGCRGPAFTNEGAR
jgi:hypothetical protein